MRAGTVDKYLQLRDGHSAIYQRHVVNGMSGINALGHHAMLKLPDTAGCGRISTSGFQHGQVLPFPFEDPEIGGYHALKPDLHFAAYEKYHYFPVALQISQTTPLAKVSMALLC